MIQLDERLSAAAELAGECAVFYDGQQPRLSRCASAAKRGRAGARVALRHQRRCAEPRTGDRRKRGLAG